MLGRAGRVAVQVLHQGCFQVSERPELWPERSWHICGPADVLHHLRTVQLNLSYLKTKNRKTFSFKLLSKLVTPLDSVI